MSADWRSSSSVGGDNNTDDLCDVSEEKGPLVRKEGRCGEAWTERSGGVVNHILHD